MTPIESWERAFEEMMLSIDMKEAFHTKLDEAYRKGREEAVEYLEPDLLPIPLLGIDWKQKLDEARAGEVSKEV